MRFLFANAYVIFTHDGARAEGLVRWGRLEQYKSLLAAPLLFLL